MSEDVVKMIFAKMLVRFPLLWPKQWEDPRMLALGKEDWLQTLSKYKCTMDEIAASLDKISGQYPPNAGEFAAMCKEKPAYYPYHKDCETPELAALPHLKSDSATGRDWLKKMKKFVS